MKNILTVDQGLEEIREYYKSLPIETRNQPLVEWSYSMSTRILELQKEIEKSFNFIAALAKLVVGSTILAIIAGTVATIAMLKVP